MVYGPGFVCWQGHEIFLENVLTGSGAQRALYLVSTGGKPTMA